MAKFIVLLVLAVGGIQASASPQNSINMLLSHDYNISNSLRAVANNYNIKKTFLVDSKSICRHLGIVKAAIDASETTLNMDQELAKIAVGTRIQAKLSALDVLISQTTSYCGRNYASEGAFESSLESNDDFLVRQMGQINSAYGAYGIELARLRSCVVDHRYCK